jgi:hypothetical protein
VTDRPETHVRARAVGLVVGGLAAAVSLHGCAVSPAPTAERAAPVVAGTPSADEAVVAIRYVDGELRCSGTLIAPRVVLTAGHCGVHAQNYWGFEVFVGPDVRGPGTRVPVVDAVRHPAFEPVSFANDVALLFLGQDVPVAPKPLRKGPLTPSDVASDVRVVGYGRTAGDRDDAGLRRTGASRITDFTAFEATLAGGSQPCSFDSGGATFTTEAGVEVLTFVTSRGDGACASYARVVRVDTYRDFVDAYLAATAAGSQALGARCLYDAHCASGICQAAPEDARVRHCSAACVDDATCGALRCLPSDAGPRCQYPRPTPRAPGASCVVDADCFDAACLAAPDGAMRCAPACSPTRATCPADLACTSIGDVRWACFPAAPADPPSGCTTERPAPARTGATLLAGLTTTMVWARRRSRRGSRPGA